MRLLCVHEMTKHVCKIISRLNSKRLLRKLQKMLGGYFFLPHPVDGPYKTDSLVSRLTASGGLDITLTSNDRVTNRVGTTNGLFQAIFGDSNDLWIVWPSSTLEQADRLYSLGRRSAVVKVEGCTRDQIFLRRKSWWFSVRCFVSLWLFCNICYFQCK